MRFPTTAPASGPQGPMWSFDEAAREKVLAAERNVAGVRAAIITLNVAVYYGLMEGRGIPWLAAAVTAVALPYGFLVLLARPYRRYPILLSAGFTSLTDALLITLWILATGGYESPFYVLWYVSLAAIAFRFGFRETIVSAAVYALAYTSLLVGIHEFLPNLADNVVRLSYIFFVGLVGAFLSKETYEQTQAKLQMRDLMLESQRQAERLERKEAELRQSLSLLSATLDSTADGILVVDASNRIESYNRKFAQMWGIPDEILQSREDQRALKYVLDQLKDPGAFIAKVQELYAHPEETSFDVLEFKDGRVFERYSQAQRLGGKAVGRVWSFRDVTEKRRADQEKLANLEREKELQRLKELDAFKTRFVNSVAHELWTPLTPIRLQLHMLKGGEPGPLTERQRRSIDMIIRNMERLILLVEEMLEGARLQAGRFRVNRAPMDLAQVVREMVDLFHVAARHSGVTLSADVARELPIDGDSNRLVQVMHNLLSNALKFTPIGGRVDVEAKVQSGVAVVRVRDTGPGLTEEQIARMFQAFGQVHEPMQRTQQGTGLGLYISQAIIDAHGGRIWAESEGPERGSVFTFTLPLRDAPAGASAGAPVAPGVR